ncbi:hypothetical protein Tco_1286530, partial [Tanacetum coccineum]
MAISIISISSDSSEDSVGTPAGRVILFDALRDSGIDARVVVETIDRDETETGVRGPVEV